MPCNILALQGSTFAPKNEVNRALVAKKIEKTMAVKLIKACKDLNVGMKTVSDFCALMGYPIPSDPNYRIDDDLYMLLQKEFGFDRKPNHRGIQSIGVANFRKFEKLEPVSLDGVTYVVGGNNAGKSTIVKALRLVVENLCTLKSVGSDYSQAGMTPLFRFDLKGLNIGTFEKALYRNASIKAITFRSQLSDDVNVALTVEPTTENSAIAVVTYLRIEDSYVKFAFELDMKEGKMRLFNIGGSPTTEDAEVRLKKLNTQLKETQNKLDDIQAQLENKVVVLPYDKMMDLINKSTQFNAEKEKQEKIIKTVEVEIKTRQKGAGTPAGELLFETTPSLNNDNPSDNLLVRFMKGMQVQLSTQNTKSQSQKSKSPVYVMNLDRMIGNYRWALTSSAIEYIGAHAATQKTIFSVDDYNDETVAIIHEWMQQQILPGEPEYEFIDRWMKTLNIGIRFAIENHFGEAYSVNVTEREGEKPSSLSELGMGAIQMMTLLLHISSIMRKYAASKVKPLVVFEEPEQNMHPNWQSHLAEIFNDMRLAGFRVMVETHSEYIIRKSQIQVAEMKFVDQDDLNENCEIATYYFPADGAPYKMGYRTSGGFMNQFGEGFFDEAAKWDMAIIQNEVSNPVRRRR